MYQLQQLASSTPDLQCRTYYLNLGLTIKDVKPWSIYLTQRFPNACRIGMASQRHLSNGCVKSSGVTLILSYFERSHLLHHTAPYDANQAEQSGEQLFAPFLAQNEPDQPNAYIVLVDSKEALQDEFFHISKENDLTISGGRAGIFDQDNSWVLYQDTLYQNQAVAVGIVGQYLSQQRDAFVDNIAIGRRMLVTASEGNIIRQLDHLPAQQIYQRYLSNGERISLSLANRFALTTVHNNVEINAVPLSWEKDGAIMMSEALPEGAYVKFLYFHPAQSLHSIVPKVQHLNEQRPDSIFVFNCISRTDFIGERPSSKLSLLNQVSPLHGTYCFGEFFSTQFGTRVMQHALTYLALSESSNHPKGEIEPIQLPDESDSLAPMFNLISNAFQDLEQEHASLASPTSNASNNDWLRDLQTGLLNRFSLLGRLNNRQDTAHLAVIRIRNFRLINQQYSYNTADNLLAQLAHYLKRRLSTNAVGIEFTCYRLSANEIAVSIHSQIAPSKVFRLFRHLAEDIESQEFSTIKKAEHLLTLSLSVGLASAFDLKGNPLCEQTHLLIKASEARRFAQIHNQPIYWNGNLPERTTTEENLDWILKIRKALENNDIVAYFQPYYDSQTGEEIGAEALLRARIDGEIVSPALFLDLIKQTQLYAKITLAMLAKCERILSTYPKVHVALNLSVLDFKHYATLKALRQFFKRNQVNGRLTLEITESESIQDYEWISPIIDEFRAAGALLAVDDFGAGYSNLEKLIALNPDILKLDGCIIKTIDKDEKLQKLVEHINNLAHSLGIKTQAEFVHNETVMQKLVALKIDYLQGFHLSEPLSEADWLAQHDNIQDH
ncbi:EAL domain-containing protein [Marinomonas sp. M1K-6]|uniref:EAL domain-containing protein n=1 Tax=Marinomonas profundi TaxID=2726122 RepID=A0A847QUX6_9GAMM|nr:EAL domain-containing protein [Marinomonas profundi]NLQ16448.1 EAL domain-containing protein [Marinomonas profundi]UDV03961.1 EAL domain-containing protein [Marinomonas profundi]